MKKISSAFIAKEQSINIKELKSRCLNKLMGLSTNQIVSFINKHNGFKELTFIFEKKCSEESIFLYSQLFLNTILFSYPDLLKIKDFKLVLGDHAISSSFHYSSKLSSIFSHSIILRKGAKHFSVAHLNDSPKDFAINISNSFCYQTNLIQKQL